MSVPNLPSEWYHRRFQAVGRAQSRYLLLLLVVTAYSVGQDFTSGHTVSVAFLGLPDVPKAIVDAGAMVVLSVVLLALYGSFDAARKSFADLLTRLGTDGVGADMSQVDEHPNVADFLGVSRWRILALVLYPAPILAALARTGVLWWRGFDAMPTSNTPAWLPWVYRLWILVLLALAWRTVRFFRRRWELFSHG